MKSRLSLKVATVLTVYGIETHAYITSTCYCHAWLQQYLPFTVLKLENFYFVLCAVQQLQQYLPFTVLKRIGFSLEGQGLLVATVLTVYGIETNEYRPLRHLPQEMVATVLTVYGIET